MNQHEKDRLQRTKEKNEHVLKNSISQLLNQRGYFQQIMQQVAITGFHMAKLLFWSKKGFSVH